MTIINLTPHAVVIYDNDGKTILATVQPSGEVARVSMTRQQVGHVTGTDIPIFISASGDVTGVPDPQAGKIYLVSALVRLALKGRRDVLSPGELIRNEAGQPVGCRGLEANA